MIYMEKNGSKDKIAKNVIKAKLKDGVVTVMDSAGSVTRVANASIVTVDTLTQELIFKNEP
jgi:hypothetical protein